MPTRTGSADLQGLLSAALRTAKIIGPNDVDASPNRSAKNYGNIRMALNLLNLLRGIRLIIVGAASWAWQRRWGIPGSGARSHSGSHTGPCEGPCRTPCRVYYLIRRQMRKRRDTSGSARGWFLGYTSERASQGIA